AIATPPSWLSETCQRLTPSSRATSAAPPVTLSSGLPLASRRTSASRWLSPRGAPSALATASLAANRAASDWIARSRSISVNRRSRSAGVRSRAARKRAMSTTSTPMPRIIVPGYSGKRRSERTPLPRSPDGDGAALFGLDVHVQGVTAGPERGAGELGARVAGDGFEAAEVEDLAVSGEPAQVVVAVAVLAEHERAPAADSHVVGQVERGGAGRLVDEPEGAAPRLVRPDLAAPVAGSIGRLVVRVGGAALGGDEVDGALVVDDAFEPGEAGGARGPALVADGPPGFGAGGSGGK